MSRPARSESKGFHGGLEKPTGAVRQGIGRADLPPTTGQRVFFWITTVLLAAWLILLGLLAWWSCR